MSAGGQLIMVDACLREGIGGSPTAVLIGRPLDALDDADLARIPARTGASHVAVVTVPGGRGGGRADESTSTVRFFTSAGELPSCGHGTVAAIAVLTGREFEGWLTVSGHRVRVTGRTGPDDVVEAWFDQGVVRRREVRDDERAAFLDVLGLTSGQLHPDDQVTVASPGRERLLIPVPDRDVLARLRPDPERLAEVSRRYGQLGCFVHVPLPAGDPGARAAARMFAPAIGVPEDVANANSTGCLAAHQLRTGRPADVVVDQGDALGRPSTVLATAVRTTDGEISTQVGGFARIGARHHL